MIIERVKESATVYNKMNGKIYTVQETDGRKYAVENVEEGEDAEIININENNCIIFRCLQDAEPEIPEGYTVDEGILLKNGEPATRQGDIEVLEIVGCEKGKVLIFTKNGENKNFGYYMPERDIFTSLETLGKDAKVAAKADGVIAIIDTAVHEEKDEDGRIEVEILDKSDIFFYEAGSIMRYSLPYLPEKIDLFTEHGNLILYVRGREEDEEGILGKEVKHRILFFYQEDYEVHMAGAPVTSCKWAYLYGHEGLLVKTEKELAYYEGGSVETIHIPLTKADAAKLAGYDHLVDVTRLKSIMLFTLANDQYDIIKVRSDKTRDRGYLVDIL